MMPIEPDAARRHLQALAGRPLFLHLETTMGAYTQGAYGAFARNVPVTFHEAGVAGRGPYRVALRLAGGWVYAEGLTHWQPTADGGVEMAGFDAEGRLTVALQLRPEPFPLRPPATETEAAPARPDGPGFARRDPTPTGGLLVVLPHPDDESFACAGLMALTRRRGEPVTCVCATAGQLGRNLGRPRMATRETLPALRVQELRQALAALDVRDLRLLGLFDKTVEFEDQAALAARILAVLEERRPETVVTFHPEFGGHPDHCALGAAVLEEVRRLPAGQRPRVLFPVIARADGEPDAGLPVLAVDIRAVSDRKQAAFSAHRTQTAGWPERMERDDAMRRRFERLFREERFWVLQP